MLQRAAEFVTYLSPFLGSPKLFPFIALSTVVCILATSESIKSRTGANSRHDSSSAITLFNQSKLLQTAQHIPRNIQIVHFPYSPHKMASESLADNLGRILANPEKLSELRQNDTVRRSLRDVAARLSLAMESQGDSVNRIRETVCSRHTTTRITSS
jgi:hypothetical protein